MAAKCEREDLRHPDERNPFSVSCTMNLAPALPIIQDVIL